MAVEREFEINRVEQLDLIDLIPLMRAYCDFYEARPRQERLTALSRALLGDARCGVQLLARSRSDGKALGFATIYWTYSTLAADQIGVMNDLYVAPEARRQGVGRALIDSCRGRCREKGAGRLTWSTAPDNATARRLYDAVGAQPSSWIEYEIDAW